MNSRNKSAFDVPLTPSALPQQRLTAVRQAPNKPPELTLISASLPDQIVEDEFERVVLCQLEWAWSPMNNRIQLWTLAPSICRQYVILTTGLFNDQCLFHADDEPDDEFEPPEPWDYYYVGYSRFIQGVQLRDHAILLLIEALLLEREDSYLDCYHWINRTALLDSSDLTTVGRAVWPEEFGDE